MVAGVDGWFSRVPISPPLHGKSPVAEKLRGFFVSEAFSVVYRCQHLIKGACEQTSIKDIRLLERKRPQAVELELDRRQSRQLPKLSADLGIGDSG